MFIVSNSFAQWVQNYWTTAHISSVYFYDSLTGYATLFSGEILKTTDAGNTWTLISTIANDNTLQEIFFTSPDTGYAVGISGVIIKTTNGGLNWNYQNSNTNEYLQSVYFTDKNTGYVTGDGGTILKTVDAGANWIPQTSGTTDWLISVKFTDSNNGYIAGGYGTYGRILKTTNGGVDWSITPGISTELLHSVFFVDEQTGYAVGNYGTLLKTTNAGVDWQTLTFSSNYHLTSVWFTDANTGYVVGNSSNGVIFKTIDGGATWAQQLNEGYGLNAVCFINASIGCAVGGYTILRTSNAGETFIDENAGEHFFSVHPNPTSDNITINILNTDDEFIECTIHNVIGSLIKSVPLINTAPYKTISFNIDLASISNGVYMVSVKTKKLNHTQKILIHR